MKLSLITHNELTQERIGEGDAGVILRADGSWSIFNCHEHINPDNMTDRQVEQGAALQAFALLLRLPHLMGVVNGMAADPDIVGKTLDLGPLH